MIQRIQTLWLLIASAFSFLSIRFSFYNGNESINGQKVFMQLNATATIPLIVLTVIVAVVSLITIFLYKDRSLQIKLTTLALIVSIIDIVLYFVEKEKFVPAESSFNLAAAFTFLIPIFLFLALRGIIKDRKLIKSVDRLR